MQAAAAAEDTGDRKRAGSSKDQTISPKKRKMKTVDVDLPNAPVDGKHPLEYAFNTVPFPLSADFLMSDAYLVFIPLVLLEGQKDSSQVIHLLSESVIEAILLFAF